MLSDILRRDIPKDNKKCSPLNLAAELKKKMKIIEGFYKTQKKILNFQIFVIFHRKRIFT